jgi:hypothetical protein
MMNKFLGILMFVGVGPFLSLSADDNFEMRAVKISQWAGEEVSVVSRLQSLREATEKLPANWKAPSFDKPSEEVNRDALLAELGEMEFAAAERWNILINNMAILRLQSKDLDDRSKHWISQLPHLTASHKRINQQLDQYHSRLKEAILMNLAEQIQIGTGAEPAKKLD